MRTTEIAVEIGFFSSSVFTIVLPIPRLPNDNLTDRFGNRYIRWYYIYIILCRFTPRGRFNVEQPSARPRDPLSEPYYRIQGDPLRCTHMLYYLLLCYLKIKLNNF